MCASHRKSSARIMTNHKKDYKAIKDVYVYIHIYTHKFTGEKYLLISKFISKRKLQTTVTEGNSA
jgi:hypothetical protein